MLVSRLLVSHVKVWQRKLSSCGVAQTGRAPLCGVLGNQSVQGTHSLRQVLRLPLSLNASSDAAKISLRPYTKPSLALLAALSLVTFPFALPTAAPTVAPSNVRLPAPSWISPHPSAEHSVSSISLSPPTKSPPTTSTRLSSTLSVYDTNAGKKNSLTSSSSTASRTHGQLLRRGTIPTQMLHEVSRDYLFHSSEKSDFCTRKLPWGRY